MNKNLLLIICVFLAAPQMVFTADVPRVGLSDVQMQAAAILMNPEFRDLVEHLPQIRTDPATGKKVQSIALLSEFKLLAQLIIKNPEMLSLVKKGKANVLLRAAYPKLAQWVKEFEELYHMDFTTTVILLAL